MGTEIWIQIEPPPDGRLQQRPVAGHDRERDHVRDLLVGRANSLGYDDFHDRLEIGCEDGASRKPRTTAAPGSFYVLDLDPLASRYHRAARTPVASISGARRVAVRGEPPTRQPARSAQRGGPRLERVDLRVELEDRDVPRPIDGLRNQPPRSTDACRASAASVALSRTFGKSSSRKPVGSLVGSRAFGRRTFSTMWAQVRTRPASMRTPAPTTSCSAV